MKVYPNNIVELLSFLVAIYYYPFFKKTFMKWFLPFLGFIFFGELYAQYEGFILLKSNYDVYYLIGIIESIFYGYIFYHMSHRSYLKKLILLFIPIIVLGFSVGFFFYLHIYRYFFLISIVEGFLLSVIALLYLYIKVTDDEDGETNLISEPGFWIAAGVSLFFSVVSISFSLSHIIIQYQLNLFDLPLYDSIASIVCIVLYVSIAIGLIQSKKKYASVKK